MITRRRAASDGASELFVDRQRRAARRTTSRTSMTHIGAPLHGAAAARARAAGAAGAEGGGGAGAARARRDELVFMTGGRFDSAGSRAASSRAAATPARTASRSRWPPTQAEALARALLAQPEVKPAGLGARDTLRLEAGLCLYGHDIDDRTTPVEAALTWAIQKVRRAGGARAGGYPGRRAVIDGQLATGVTNKRVGLVGLERVPVREGTVARRCARPALGHVTSGTLGADRRQAGRDGLPRRRPHGGEPRDLRRGARQAGPMASARCRSSRTATTAAPESCIPVRAEPFEALFRSARQPFGNHPTTPFPGAPPMTDQVHQRPRVDQHRGPRGRRRRHHAARAGRARRRGVRRPARGRPSFKPRARSPAWSNRSRRRPTLHAGRRARSPRSTRSCAPTPSLANSDPMGNGWFFKVRVNDMAEFDAADGRARLRRSC